MTKPFTRLRLAGLAALILASAPALAAKPFSANYQANYMGMQGNGRMVLEPAGAGKWRYTLTITSSLANLTQSTVFDEANGGLRPLSGNDRSNVVIKKIEKNADYDWGSGVATWSGDVKDDRKGPVKLQSGDLDALLVNLAIVRDAQAGKPLSYRMVDDGRVRQMTYKVAGKDTITVGGASRQATKVVSTSGEKTTTIWVVDGMPVPARIVQTGKGGKDGIELRVK